MLKLNSDENYVNNIINGVNKKDGYCPCQVGKTDGSKCPFYNTTLPNEVDITDICINGQDIGKCCCKLYI